MTRQIGSPMAAILAATMTLGGCTRTPAPSQVPAKAAAAKPDGHDHSHEDGDHHDHEAGPHGGALAEWGECDYHLEFTVDHDRKEAVVYVFGSDEKTASPIEAADGKILLTINEPAFQVELAARPLPGETDGRASVYAGTHDDLGAVRAFAGTISGAVDGTPFAGEFTEEAHGDHGHE